MLSTALLLLASPTRSVRCHDGCPQHQAQPRSVLIDLGSNCGDTYQTMQQMFEPLQASSAEFFLWEPMPVLLEAYLRRIASNDSRVRLVEAAAWVSDGNATFFQSQRDERLSPAQTASRWHCNVSERRKKTQVGNPHGSATLIDARTIGASICARVRPSMCTRETLPIGLLPWSCACVTTWC